MKSIYETTHEDQKIWVTLSETKLMMKNQNMEELKQTWLSFVETEWRW